MKTLCRLILLSSIAAPTVSSAQSAYVRTIQTERATAQRTFIDPATSPLDRTELRAFTGLAFFPIDSAYRVTARFTRSTERREVTLATSTGKPRPYLAYGALSFTLAGKPQTLTVYRSEELAKQPEYADYLLVPFTDATSGRESYGGGRYLDARTPTGSTLTLDFNLAYQPTCAYSHRYSCPIPPRANRLTVPVRAGARLQP